MDKNDLVRDNEILTPVQGDEILYRSVRGEEGKEYTTKSNGKPDFNYEAFKATNRKPSVDRAILRDHPSLSLLSDTDGIVSLIAGQVRGIKSVERPEGGEAVYAVDVIYAPTIENHAHAEIIVIPEYFGSRNKRRLAYRLLRIALALLANENGWTLPPPKQ